MCPCEREGASPLQVGQPDLDLQSAIGVEMATALQEPPPRVVQDRPASSLTRHPWTRSRTELVNVALCRSVSVTLGGFWR